MKVRVYESEPGWYYGQVNDGLGGWKNATKIHKRAEWAENELKLYLADRKALEEYVARDLAGQTTIKEWEV